MSTTATTATRRSWPQLARLALEAHRLGTPWGRFWPSVARDVRRLQAECPNSRLPLYGRLLSIATHGDEDGTQPIGSPDMADPILAREVAA